MLFGSRVNHSTFDSRRTAFIDTLDDDCLLHIFYLYRRFFLGYGDDSACFKGTIGDAWWYKLIHVCQRWRIVIFQSASYLGLSLVCTKGTPVADMLAHSPSLPLVIDYIREYHGIPAEDEQRAIIALKQRDRVRRINLELSIANLQKLLLVIKEEYPILEHLTIRYQIKDNRTFLTLPETLEAPHLRHLTLVGFALPIGFRLLATAVRLVTLCLTMNSPSTHFHPNSLLQWLSSMPQLETLIINFIIPARIRDEETQLTHPSVMTPVTLPNLRYFWFQGHGSYLEALVQQITPCPEKLGIRLSNESTFCFSRLAQFINSAKNLKFETVKFKFSGLRVTVEVYPHGEAEICALSMDISGRDFDWHVSWVEEFLDFFSQFFSSVERLSLEFGVVIAFWSDEQPSFGLDRIEWRRLLGSFGNVRTLLIDDALAAGVFRCLQLDDGEFRLELLPELQEIAYYSGSGSGGDAFTPFIDARQKAGRPITLTTLLKIHDSFTLVMG
jgi:hypothetical protein